MPCDDEKIYEDRPSDSIGEYNLNFIDRKMNNNCNLKADEVFESDDYRSLKLLAKEFEREENEKNLMELCTIQSKGKFQTLEKEQESLTVVERSKRSFHEDISSSRRHDNLN